MPMPARFAGKRIETTTTEKRESLENLAAAGETGRKGGLPSMSAKGLSLWKPDCVRGSCWMGSSADAVQRSLD